MVIIAGHVTVDPEQRESHLEDIMRVVEKARGANGCLDFAIDGRPARSRAAFTSSSAGSPGPLSWPSASEPPASEQGAALLSGSVAEYDVADARPLFEKGNDDWRLTTTRKEH